MLTEQQKELVKATVPTLRKSGITLTDYFYKRMLKNNPDLKETFNMGHQRSGAQASALASAVLAYAENIDDPSVLISVIELVCNKHVSLNIQAPDYDIVGENLLYSISEVLDISMEDPLKDAWKVAYFQLADVFIATEQKIYQQHANTQGGWQGWRNFIVDRKVQESDEITSFYLVPEDGKRVPLYTPGQYITVRVFIPELGIKQPRQYSLSGMPGEGFLRISVKKENAEEAGQDPGYVSSILHNIIKENDRVELSSPSGNFILFNENKTNVLISAGVGLTPIMSMLKVLAKKSCPVSFIHTARNSSVHAFGEEIKSIAKANSSVKIHINFSNIQPHDIHGVDYHSNGHLILDELNKDLLPIDADYYLCGPLGFMLDKRKELINMGISVENIYSEAFGTGGVPN